MLINAEYVEQVVACPVCGWSATVLAPRASERRFRCTSCEAVIYP